MRYALALVCLLFAASAHAASIQVGGPQPANTIVIQPVFVDVHNPSDWDAKSPTDPNPVQFFGWHRLNYFDSDPSFLGVHFELPHFYIDQTEALFQWRPAFVAQYAVVNVAEFVAAGDTTLTMRVDTSRVSVPGPAVAPMDFHIITWESLNLGVVTRTYFRTPEPASAALLALCPLALRRPRRRN
jgi:hypothetical protein